MLGTTFGPYRIEELLGRGGMGEVYRAYDVERDRMVALKVLPPHLAEDEEYQERFRRECRAAARLNEPHIVPIHTFGEIDGRLFLDMRLVEGVDLAGWLKTHGAMPAEAAVAVVSQIASALDAAHAAGLVHRDVKPSNVLLAGVHDGRVDREIFAYLFDFGIARAQEGTGDDPVLTRAGTMPGSLAYIAPERFSGVEGDPRADTYALACVLHQALTGRAPYEGDLATLMRAHLSAPPPRPSSERPELPPGLDRVVAQGMAKDPAQRPASAGALAAAARAEIGATSQASNPRTAVVPPGWNSAPRNAAPQNAPQNFAGQNRAAAPPTSVGWAGGGAARPPGQWFGSPQGPPGGPGPTQQAWGGGGYTSHPSHPSYPSGPPPYPTLSSGAHPSGSYGTGSGSQPYRQPPKNGSRTVLAVVAVLVVLAVAGGGIAWALLSTGSSSGSGGSSAVALPPTSTLPPTTVPPTSISTPESDRLLAELPAGYGATNCDPSSLPGAVATVTCASAPTTGDGPTSATFTRYASVTEMDAAFTTLADEEGIPPEVGPIENCNTNGTSRGRYTRPSGSLGGQVGCFTDIDGTAYLFWTDEAALAIAYVGQNEGAAGALYTWWNSVDFQAER